jgi:hypothetical protein
LSKLKYFNVFEIPSEGVNSGPVYGLVKYACENTHSKPENN